MLSGTNKNIFSVFSFRQFYPNLALNFDKIIANNSLRFSLEIL